MVPWFTKLAILTSTAGYLVETILGITNSSLEVMASWYGWVCPTSLKYPLCDRLTETILQTGMSFFLLTTTLQVMASSLMAQCGNKVFANLRVELQRSVFPPGARSMSWARIASTGICKMKTLCSVSEDKFFCPGQLFPVNRQSNLTYESLWAAVASESPVADPHVFSMK